MLQGVDWGSLRMRVSFQTTYFLGSGSPLDFLLKALIFTPRDTVFKLLSLTLAVICVKTEFAMSVSLSYVPGSINALYWR